MNFSGVEFSTVARGNFHPALTEAREPRRWNEFEASELRIGARTRDQYALPQLLHYRCLLRRGSS